MHGKLFDLRLVELYGAAVEAEKELALRFI